MPLYPINGLRGNFTFHGISERALYRNTSGEDVSIDEDSDLASDSVSSVPSPGDVFYEFDVGHPRSNLSEDFTDYVHDDLAHHEDSSGSESASALSGSASPTPPPHLASRLRDLGLADSDLSDPPDFVGDETDDDTHETESDGELSNPASAVESRDLDILEECDEVPNPPNLPVVPEERLQEVWPLGDSTFSIFLCPITHDVMTDPVVSADGYTYEREAIARWFESSRKSPVTGQTLPHTDLVPNQSVRTLLKTLIDMTDCTPSQEEEKLPSSSSSTGGQPSSPSRKNNGSEAASTFEGSASGPANTPTQSQSPVAACRLSGSPPQRAPGSSQVRSLYLSPSRSPSVRDDQRLSLNLSPTHSLSDGGDHPRFNENTSQRSHTPSTALPPLRADQRPIMPEPRPPPGAPPPTTRTPSPLAALHAVAPPPQASIPNSAASARRAPACLSSPSGGAASIATRAISSGSVASNGVAARGQALGSVSPQA